MHKNNYLDELENCITLSDVEKIFRNKKFANRGQSNFFSESIAVMDSGNILTNAKVKVDGFLGLFFRVIVFLKFDGKIGNKPRNVGESSYFNQLHNVFVGIASLKKVLTIEDIDSELINSFVKLELEKGNKAMTISHKIKTLIDVVYYLDEFELPYIFRLEEKVFTNSTELVKLKKMRSKEVQESLLISNAKIPFPLDHLKVIISHSIEYLEKYSIEALEVAKLYNSTKQKSNDKKYRIIFEYFKKSKIEFTEPNLHELQINIKSVRNKYKNSKGKNKGRGVNNIIKTILDTVNEIEISCISVALMLTGMRVGELCTLNRNLKITQDEHYHLERIIYKTADSEEGEPLEMPIPAVCKKALEVLSELSKIKDGEQESIILSPIMYSDIKSVRTARINKMLVAYCERLGLDEHIAPHQFRHAMAFLIVHIHENEGLELARMFLGHSSIVMTLQYMGNFNNELNEAISELQREESEQLVGAITKQIQENKKLFGENGKRLMPNHQFTGQQVDEFVKLMRKGLINLIEEQKLLIIQTPVSLCMHDLSKPEKLVCQRGLDILDIATSGPAPSRCKGAECANALFFEEHIEKIKDDMYGDIDPVLRERLEKNTYFMEAEGFEQDPFKRLIKEYEISKKETA